jgi:hypothetical protein
LDEEEDARHVAATIRTHRLGHDLFGGLVLVICRERQLDDLLAPESAPHPVTR